MRRAFSDNVGKNQEHLTPPWLVEALGKFDLDPCAVKDGPWVLATNNYTIEDDGLSQDWNGWRSWMNPPFDRYEVTDWYKKMAFNNNGIALQIGKTEVKWFTDYVKPVATSMLLMDKRFKFLKRDGTPHEKGNCGGSPILVAYGELNSDALEDSGIGGAHVPLNLRPIFMVNIDGTWAEVVRIGLAGAKDYDLQELYAYIQARWPDKCARNPFWQEQIRKQLHFFRKSQTHG